MANTGQYPPGIRPVFPILSDAASTVSAPMPRSDGLARLSVAVGQLVTALAFAPA